MAQHHRRRQDRRHRIGLALPGNIGRGAVDRFIEAEGAMIGLTLAQRGARQQTNRTHRSARQIGEDIAEQVARQHHAEAVGWLTTCIAALSI